MNENINKDDFIGKTIKDICVESENQIDFEFEDGSHVSLEVECISSTLQCYGLTTVKV